MTTLLVSDFKARCLGVLDRVHTHSETVLITRRGKPLAKIVPVGGAGAGRRVLGTMAGESVAKGDLVHTGLGRDWESAR